MGSTIYSFPEVSKNCENPFSIVNISIPVGIFILYHIASSIGKSFGKRFSLQNSLKY